MSFPSTPSVSTPSLRSQRRQAVVVAHNAVSSMIWYSDLGIFLNNPNGAEGFAQLAGTLSPSTCASPLSSPLPSPASSRCPSPVLSDCTAPNRPSRLQEVLQSQALAEARAKADKLIGGAVSRCRSAVQTRRQREEKERQAIGMLVADESFKCRGELEDF
jgi:hypothetical protein